MGFPCPDAASGWDQCETGVQTSAAALVQKKRSVDCPGNLGRKCSGNQCCPGIPETGGKTFPCPDAASGWNQCETGVQTSAAALVQKQRSVDCPGNFGRKCSGNQCCPGTPETGGKTFPCP